MIKVRVLPGHSIGRIVEGKVIHYEAGEEFSISREKYEQQPSGFLEIISEKKIKILQSDIITIKEKKEIKKKITNKINIQDEIDKVRKMTWISLNKYAKLNKINLGKGKKKAIRKADILKLIISFIKKG